MNRPSEIRPIELPPDQFDALAVTLARFGGPARRRGEDYYRGARVRRLSVHANGFRAEVLGTEDYVVFWSWERRTWSVICSCPVGLWCKHACAVGLAILDSAVAAAEAVAPLAPQHGLERRLGRARDSWERRAHVRDILVGRTFAMLSAFDPSLEPILDDPDPDILCWRLVDWVGARSGGVLPPELEPYRDRDDLCRRFEERERTLLGNAILAWSQAAGAPAPRSLRFVWTLSRRGDDVRLDVAARLTSTRLDDAHRNVDQLRTLLDEARRGVSGLPSDVLPILDVFVDTAAPKTDSWGHGVPPKVLTLAARAVAMLRAAGNEHPAIVWGSDLDPELAERAGVAPGQPLRLAPGAVDILPGVNDADGEPSLDLACIAPDGSSRPLGSVVFFPGSTGASGAVVLWDGALRTVNQGPPAAILERHREVGPVPLAATNRVAILAPLMARFPHMRAALAAHVRTVGARSLVALHLDEDDWLQVRLFVHDAPEDWMPHEPPPAGSIVLELHPDDVWRRAVTVAGEARALEPMTTAGESAANPVPAAAPEAEAAEAQAASGQESPWLLEPDPAIAVPLRSWLERLRAEPAARGRPGGHAPTSPHSAIGWWVQVTPRRVDDIAAAWDERPGDVPYVGNERARRLLCGGLSARPRIEIRSSGVDWFSVSAAWESEGLALTEADMNRLRASGERFVRLRSGWVRRDPADDADADAALQALADLGIETGAGPQALTPWQLIGVAPESLQQFVELAGNDPETRRALRRLRREIEQFDGLPEVEVPAGVEVELRPYQRRGLDFLAWTAKVGLGAVLADDMGLGKTLQALAWIQHLVDARPRGGPTLVVCPTSVMHNWAREAARFTPGLRVLLLERGAQRRAQHQEVQRHHLVITNYALLRRDIDAWRETRLRAVILDEAQNIKNPDAAVSKAVFSLEAKHRLALTGTPLENRPLDLWSLARFLNPGYLGDRGTFSACYERPDASPHSRRLLTAKLRPFLLRRLKSEVAADLPERIEERRDCELTTGQRRLYLTELRRSRQLVDDLAADPAALRKNRILILAALTRLRQICCHPALVRGAASLGSGKFEAFFELLEPLLSEGHKVLVFSQFVQCLNLLEKEMKKRRIRHHVLTGATTRRAQVVADFQEQEGPGVFLISLKAGGTGLNLTAASYVVLFDPWWNPAVEAQAIDRSHRIGQDRTVIAYRLISSGTIEERIWEMQQRKAEMVRDILGEGGFTRALTREDLAYLLSP